MSHFLQDHTIPHAFAPYAAQPTTQYPATHPAHTLQHWTRLVAQQTVFVFALLFAMARCMWEEQV